ncbi:hypothetical protein C3747_7g544 [Trypanosoma cruzi]|uniref:Uncharacterized protein n=2 Tax=Trypanosoma cruzi TaxID=5693 RepID=Q4DGY2_TRYCC|nr:hypothetical protein, conserved [Trypanosoma cruzi]EAN91778.1 hypothetical protein, conserved [Trypanosoma cruzi]PWV20044.1 hypothetical protein C3747_7g544 [Trypanosoma cruzi]RNC46775.1 hypothetical protein TcCL_NonESM03377 [Trypanosoma cruzi]|eukprot:XP_813629.1 hypothetical protein [Trypanosoma cruzi strain CL Brener]
MAALVVVQRFRECQNLLDTIVANLSAISNLTSQRIVVEEAIRRTGCSAASATANDNALRCCTDPLGMLLAFPESAVELIIAQHTEDVSALLRSLGKLQQMWCSKLQQAKEASQQRQQQGASMTKAAASALFQVGGRECKEKSTQSPQVMLGMHALLAVLARMHGWLQELILALRADLANPPRAVQLSQCLTRYFSQMEGAGCCTAILALETALEQLPERVQREWEVCKARHMVDEAWILLAS